MEKRVVLDALKSIYCKTKKTQEEICGHVYKMPDGKYYYQKPGNKYSGTSKANYTCNVNPMADLEQYLVVFYHSHPNGEGSEKFSNILKSNGKDEGDIPKADAFIETDGIKDFQIYLITPSKNTLLYPDKDGFIKTLGKLDINCD